MTEADKLIREWEQATIDKVVRQDDGQHRFNGFADVPELLSVVVSDAIHNLRAALDYLIYELTLWDSYGMVEDGTQFPIEGRGGDDPVICKRRFNGRRESYLKGLNVQHASAIEALQPYNGVEWTETLRDISNPDKHRHLTVVTKRDKVMTQFHWHPEGRFTIDDFDENSLGHTIRRFDLKLDGQQAITILLPKRGEVPLLPTLRRLEAEVARTIELFKPEF